MSFRMVSPAGVSVTAGTPAERTQLKAEGYEDVPVKKQPRPAAAKVEPKPEPKPESVPKPEPAAADAK